MKKLALILGVFILSVGAFAQEGNNVKQNDLTGPAFKNYKHWMHKSEPTKIYSQNTVTALEGPAYKNQHPSKETSKENLVQVKIGGSEKQKLTEPAYKNYGPWTQGYK
jgi:hypothetical protein